MDRRFQEVRSIDPVSSREINDVCYDRRGMIMSVSSASVEM